MTEYEKSVEKSPCTQHDGEKLTLYCQNTFQELRYDTFSLEPNRSGKMFYCIIRYLKYLNKQLQQSHQLIALTRLVSLFAVNSIDSVLSVCFLQATTTIMGFGIWPLLCHSKACY